MHIITKHITTPVPVSHIPMIITRFGHITNLSNDKVYSS